MLEIEKLEKPSYEVTDKDLLQFIRFVIKRLGNKWDLVVAVTGEEGSGKSTLAVHLAMLVDKLFDINKNVSYLPTYNEIVDKFNAINERGALVIDEAVKVLHKYRWMDKLQQLLNEMYATERYQSKVTFLCIPRFQILTENFRNHRVKIWIHVLARGVAVAFIRDDDKDTLDPWHIKESIKLKDKRFSKLKIVQKGIEKKLSIERETKNYFFDFHFPQLSPELEEQYEELKLRSRDKLSLIQQRAVTKDMMYRKIIARYVEELNERGLTKKEITGLGKTNVRNLTNWGNILEKDEELIY